MTRKRIAGFVMVGIVVLAIIGIAVYFWRERAQRTITEGESAQAGLRAAAGGTARKPGLPPTIQAQIDSLVMSGQEAEARALAARYQ